MPADITTENGKVRYNIGDIVEPYILDDTVIDALLSQYPDESSTVRVWKATIDALRILMGRFAATSARRREREGSVEVEVYNTNQYGYYKDLLDYYLGNPPEDYTDYGYNLHIFGGVSKTEKARVCNDPDSSRINISPDYTSEGDSLYTPEDRGD